jgi:hypothetical protein
MEDVECRAAFQGDTRPDQRISAKSIENVDQPDHALQRSRLKLPLGRKILKGLSRSDHQTPSKPASTASGGRSTRHGSTPTARPGSGLAHNASIVGAALASVPAPRW